ncbi:nucleotide-binding universal stress UspA family protein [Chitinophaga terrae (ex Kim and Jung 2007)]|uniref:universal stress protein n=1 Tax=Chitinophaga terrae (ex Kim and Jung 2007) TaxID=408074 RepID=UPI0027817973|nr:universal stress protein [Chitinophaga terrae (ex Kim and Jung 2007)]MDQ0108455.1 nucleotide-binding universal stress UspA family protein [Chitinophaga terrae (ex Kim and Jung 2007)]
MMKTLLVPVDFTPTSDETVRFATAWSKQYEYNRIILLKTFYENVFSGIVWSADYAAVDHVSVNADREEAQARLQIMAAAITAENENIQVTIALSESPLLRAVIDLARQEEATMIVLGSNPHVAEEGLIARNLIAIAKASPVRVLVVPAGYTFRPVDKALVPFDFKALHVLGKLQHIAIPANWAITRLLALNVNTGDGEYKPDAATEAELHEYLSPFQYDIHYESSKDIIGHVSEFTAANDVQLIVALPGKHSFLYTLTHKSISEAITRSAKVPVMILK